MVSTSTPAAIFYAAIATTFMVTTPAFCQAPTDAQRSAIRAQCRSDYEAHCASIPPGGAASLQCLQENMSSLSPPCQSAVRAVEAPSESKSKPAAAAAPAKPEPAPDTAAKAEPAKPVAGPATAPPKAASSGKQPSRAQVSAIRTACRADYPNVCAGVPTGGAPALQCLENNKAKLSAGCQKAVAAATGAAAAPAVAGAPPAAAAAPPVLVLRPMLPREELFVLRSACGADVRALCGGVAPGGGRIIQCLAVRAESLSPECRGVLSRFAAQ
jgi:hypothetical protein